MAPEDKARRNLRQRRHAKIRPYEPHRKSNPPWPHPYPSARLSRLPLPATPMDRPPRPPRRPRHDLRPLGSPSLRPHPNRQRGPAALGNLPRS